MSALPAFGRSRVPQPEPSQRLVTPRDLPRMGVCFHINHLRRLWSAEPPQFPKPFHLSARRIAWKSEVIEKWIEARIAKECDEKA